MIKFNNSMIEGDGPLHIAVSMGEDSLALSHFLANGSRDLMLLYVNHGTDYARIAECRLIHYTKWLALHPSIRLGGRHVNYKVLIGKPFPEPNEAEFRAYRYWLLDDYFEKLPYENKQLVVCHHLEDAIESYVMNCLSGSGRKTIPLRTKRNGGDYEVIRPFLKTDKEAILKYIEMHYLAQWMAEDPSNVDLSIKRNWVRHVLVPQIKEEFPGIGTTTRKVIDASQEENNEKEDYKKESRKTNDFLATLPF